MSRENPKDVPLFYLITLIGKYYFYNCDNYVELSSMVKMKLAEFYINGYQEYLYHAKVDSICKELFKTKNVKFREREFVPIYEHDVEIISTLDNDRKKKIMFTFFVIARYMECDGWINKKTSSDLTEVFHLANVNVSAAQRNRILYELHNDGYITFAKKIDNLDIRVDLGGDNAGEIVYQVREFKSVGNQYLVWNKEGFRQCAYCGRPIKITGNRKKYCAKCARIVREQQKKEWRQSQKVLSEQTCEK